MQGTDSYVAEANHVSRGHIVGAITDSYNLWYM
jgi:hypothetical protein